MTGEYEDAPVADLGEPEGRVERHRRDDAAGAVGVGQGQRVEGGAPSLRVTRQHDLLGDAVRNQVAQGASGVERALADVEAIAVGGWRVARRAEVGVAGEVGRDDRQTQAHHRVRLVLEVLLDARGRRVVVGRGALARLPTAAVSRRDDGQLGAHSEARRRRQEDGRARVARGPVAARGPVQDPVDVRRAGERRAAVGDVAAISGHVDRGIQLGDGEVGVFGALEDGADRLGAHVAGVGVDGVVGVGARDLGQERGHARVGVAPGVAAGARVAAGAAAARARTCTQQPPHTRAHEGGQAKSKYGSLHDR